MLGASQVSFIGIFLASRNISTSSFVNRHPLAASLRITGETGKMPSQGRFTRGFCCVAARGLFPVGFNTADGMKGRTELLVSKRRPTRTLQKNPALHRLPSRKCHSWLQKDQQLAGCQYGIELQSSHLYKLAKNLLV